MQAGAGGSTVELCYRSAMPKTAQAIRSGAVAILCAALLPACQPENSQTGAGSNDAIDEPTPRQLPIVEPPFDRSRLLLTVAKVASTHSTGAEDSGVQRSLDGKQFEVRLRFGCEGPAKGKHGWSVDPDGRTLRLRAVPDLTLADSAVKAISGERAEAAEGFWLPRPWLLQAACPAAGEVDATPAEGDEPGSDNTAASALSGPASVARVGIAQFFTIDDARTRRRMNRPFEAVKPLAEGKRVGQDGFDLVLAGRLQAGAGGQVIRCDGSGRDRPPDCIVSAVIDRVWIEDPTDKSLLAEWAG